MLCLCFLTLFICFFIMCFLLSNYLSNVVLAFSCFASCDYHIFLLFFLCGSFCFWCVSYVFKCVPLLFNYFHIRCSFISHDCHMHGCCRFFMFCWDVFLLLPTWFASTFLVLLIWFADDCHLSQLITSLCILLCALVDKLNRHIPSDTRERSACGSGQVLVLWRCCRCRTRGEYFRAIEHTNKAKAQFYWMFFLVLSDLNQRTRLR